MFLNTRCCQDKLVTVILFFKIVYIDILMQIWYNVHEQENIKFKKAQIAQKTYIKAYILCEMY